MKDNLLLVAILSPFIGAAIVCIVTIVRIWMGVDNEDPY